MRKTAAFALAAFGLFALSAPAIASDHLDNATNAPGADHRGFGNPDGPGNPSGGTSFDASDPRSVPGEGNPNAGHDIGTPSVDRGLVDDRSGGHGRGDQ